MAPYSFETTGRNRKTALTVVTIWCAILTAIVLFEASLWLMGGIALCTLPAVYDLAAARRSGLTLTDTGLSWFAGPRTGNISWDQISHMRLDTRLDFSVRASAVLTNGRKIRLPLESTPAPDPFEKALTMRKIKVERHHFSLVG